MQGAKVGCGLQVLSQFNFCVEFFPMCCREEVRLGGLCCAHRCGSSLGKSSVSIKRNLVDEDYFDCSSWSKCGAFELLSGSHMLGLGKSQCYGMRPRKRQTFRGVSSNRDFSKPLRTDITTLSRMVCMFVDVQVCPQAHAYMAGRIPTHTHTEKNICVHI